MVDVVPKNQQMISVMQTYECATWRNIGVVSTMVAGSVSVIGFVITEWHKISYSFHYQILLY